MKATVVRTTIETDGELHLTQLPCRKGDAVEAIILVQEESPGAKDGSNDQRDRARQAFLELARTSTFRSQGPFPTRDELHERH